MNLNQNLSRLYDELGGAVSASSKVEGILTEFYQKMSKDLMMGFFFAGKDLTHIIKQQKSFLLKAMGSGETYSGNPPGAAHTKIAPIRRGHFDRRMVLLRETLKSAGVSEAGIEAWLGFEEQFREQIVED